MNFLIKTIVLVAGLFFFSALGFSQIPDGALPKTCAGSPGNTSGAYHQQCQTSAGAVYACNNTAGCALSTDWVAQGVNALTGNNCAEAIRTHRKSSAMRNERTSAFSNRC
jgi:hypothetical protein